MSDLRAAAQQAIALICSARLCEVNSMSSRQEMLRLLIEATDLLRAVLAQQADKPQRPKCFEFALDFLGTPENGELLAYIEQLEARAALAHQAEPVQEPVAWSGYDLDGMVEAFSRVIEAHHSSKHPFHDPIDTDAKMALRILRGLIPAMKAYAAPPQRKGKRPGAAGARSA